MKKRFVVITTDNTKRGVFAGYLESQNGDVVKLTEAQNCIYWSKETKGVLGLAANGPQPGSRITSAVPTLEVNGVTALMDTTSKAEEQWKKELWS